MRVIAHGGVGSPRDMDEQVKKAVHNGSSKEKDALQTAIDVVKELEDNPVFNAGTGSRMRLDGTIQMDAAVMYKGDIGAVAAIEEIKNPIDIAGEVFESPFVMLAGKDATKFALDLGYYEYDPSTEKRREELKKMKNKLDGSEDGERLQKIREFYEKVDGGDTVGCVAEVEGKYAAAVSTGGTSYCMRGRVGDSPLVGCGFYAGEHGAVVSTGKGEEIIKRMSAKKCYDLIPELGVEKACEAVVQEYPEKISIGLIALSDKGIGSADNREMSQYEIDY